MLNKNILIVSLTLFTNLCFCQSLELRLLSEIQANPESTLCIGYEQITLIDSFPELRMFRSYFLDENDSILLGNRTKFGLDNPQSEVFFSRLKFLECFNSIGLATYKYDSLKSKNNDFIPENNSIIHFKEYNNIKYLITQDSLEWSFNIIIEHDNVTHINKIGNMNDGVLFVDFMLFDFTGGISPEIFVFKHTLIGPNELTYIQTYSVNKE